MEKRRGNEVTGNLDEIKEDEEEKKKMKELEAGEEDFQDERDSSAGKM